MLPPPVFRGRAGEGAGWKLNVERWKLNVERSPRRAATDDAHPLTLAACPRTDDDEDPKPAVLVSALCPDSRALRHSLDSGIQALRRRA